MTHLRYSGQHLCQEHFLHFFEKRAKAELAKQGRLPNGRVAVALSGGKDSMALLYFLADLARGRDDVELVAVTVDEGIAGYRDSSLPLCETACHALGVPWRTIRTADLAGYSIDEYAAGRRGPVRRDANGTPLASGPATVTQGRASPGVSAPRSLTPSRGPGPATEDAPGTPRAACGPCGVFRRVGMNRLAREVGAVAIATGHNLDDTAQTVLMNHLQGDITRLARLAPHDEARPGMVRRIQPFRTIPEKEILLYCLLRGIAFHDEECPYAVRSDRFRIRDVLVGLEEHRPGTRHALVAGQDRLKPILVAAFKDAPATTCPDCGELTSGDGCMACRWKGQST